MKYIKIGDIAKSIVSGGTPKSTQSEYYDGNIPWLNTKEINFNRIYDTEKHITEAGLNNSAAKYIKENCVIIAMYGATAGRIAINKIPLTTNQACCNIEVDSSKMNYNYLYYAIKNDWERLASLANGGAQQNLNSLIIKEFEIPYVDMNTQDKISKVLSAIDRKIELNNKINNNLHDLAEQQFNEICVKGEPKKLEELLFSVSTGSRPKGGAQESGIPSIGAEKIEKFGIYDYSSEKYVSEEYYENLKNGKLNSGDVLLYKDGAYTGKVSMCLNEFPHKKAAVNEHVFILKTENNWAQNYLYFTLYNKNNKEILHRLASSKAAQPGLNQTELKSIEVKICNKDEIINFENNVKSIMEKIANNSLENKRLAELRDALLPKLMNGEINLDNIEI